MKIGYIGSLKFGCYHLQYVKIKVGKPEGKSHWEDQDVDGRIILRWIFRKAQDRDGWRALVGTVRDFRLP